MASLDFNSIANKKLADVEPVPLPPIGTYTWIVEKLPVIRSMTSRKTGVEYDIVDFPCRVFSATDDVDASDYKGKLTDIRQTLTFMFDKTDEVAFAKSENRLRTFLEKHLKCATEDMSIREGLNAAVNQQFMAPLNVRIDDDGTPRPQIGNTAPLE